MARKSLERPERARAYNKVSHSKRRGQRTLSTYNRKLTRVKITYLKLFNNSKKSKEAYGLLPKEKQTRSKPFFCDKYNTEKSFLDKHKFRRVKV